MASGVVLTCSGLFQAFGYTVPSLVSSGVRLIAYAIPAVWLSTQADLPIEYIWFTAVAATALQLFVSLWMARTQLRDRLAELAAPAPAQA